MQGEQQMDSRDEIIAKVIKLVQAYREGALGGEKMPEDENPKLAKGSKENYMYFTLPMALNYQRNSYVLWECANKMYADEKASQKLGVISEEKAELSNIQTIVAERWDDLLKGTDLKPIDVHTPMWLWSRGKFEADIF